MSLITVHTQYRITRRPVAGWFPRPNLHINSECLLCFWVDPGLELYAHVRISVYGFWLRLFHVGFMRLKKYGTVMQKSSGADGEGACGAHDDPSLFVTQKTRGREKKREKQVGRWGGGLHQSGYFCTQKAINNPSYTLFHCGRLNLAPR